MSTCTVALEELVETAAKVKKFYLFSVATLTNVTSKTAKELFANPDFSRLENFELYSVPQAFDIEVFYEYMKKNKTTSVFLNFAAISYAYKTRLNAIVDEILGTEILDYKPPLIRFDGICDEKYRKLHSVFFRR